MVRCLQCLKSFARSRGKSWKHGVCNKCWLEPDLEDTSYEIPKLTVRRFSTPVDFYLDQYTWNEVRLLTRFN